MMPTIRAFVAKQHCGSAVKPLQERFGASSHLEERCGGRYYGLSYYIMLSFENGYSGLDQRYVSALPKMQYVQCGHVYV